MLGVEMASTGEVACFGREYVRARGPLPRFHSA